MYMYLLYKVQCRSVDGTVNFRFTVIPLHLEQQLDFKQYREITVNPFTVDYCIVYTFLRVTNICSV